MVLLRVALERRFNTRFAALMHERITGPLGISSTALPVPRDLLGRTVQGYGPGGSPIGRPGEEQGTFKWPGSGQIHSSSRDMAAFLAANMGELAGHGAIENAMAFARQILHALAQEKIRAIETKANRNRIPTDVSLRNRKQALLRSLEHPLTCLTASAIAFHCGRPQRLRGLHRSLIAAVPYVFRGRYSCW